MFVWLAGQVSATWAAVQIPPSSSTPQRTVAAERKEQPDNETSSDADARSGRARRLPDCTWAQRALIVSVCLSFSNSHRASPESSRRPFMSLTCTLTLLDGRSFYWRPCHTVSQCHSTASAPLLVFYLCLLNPCRLGRGPAYSWVGQQSVYWRRVCLVHVKVSFIRTTNKQKRHYELRVNRCSWCIVYWLIITMLLCLPCRLY